MENQENKNDTNEIRVKIEGGTIIANRIADPDYPGIKVTLKMDNGEVIDIVSVEHFIEKLEDGERYIAVNEFIDVKKQSQGYNSQDYVIEHVNMYN